MYHNFLEQLFFTERKREAASSDNRRKLSYYITYLPCGKAAKTLDWYRNKPGSTANGIYYLICHCNLLSSSAVSIFCILAQGTSFCCGTRYAFSAVLFPTVVCCLMLLPLWNACPRLLCPPSKSSRQLCASFPSASCWGLVLSQPECLASQGLFSPAHNASVPSPTQLLYPSWGTSTCSLHKSHQPQKHVASLFLSSSFWGGSIGAHVVGRVDIWHCGLA